MSTQVIGQTLLIGFVKQKMAGGVPGSSGRPGEALHSRAKQSIMNQRASAWDQTRADAASSSLLYGNSEALNGLHGKTAVLYLALADTEHVNQDRRQTLPCCSVRVQATVD